MILADAAKSRDNNFNLMRMVAASAVLVSHSFAIQGGDHRAEPLVGTLGMSLGALSVDVFFAASGFLVTASLLKRESLIEFTIARALRIYPALLVMCAAVLLVLGPATTVVPLREYFVASEFWKYLAKTSTLFFGVEYNLPGVFVENPFPRAVNGSLWSMRWEVRAYALLGIAWLACVRIARDPRAVFRSAVVGMALLSLLAAFVAMSRGFAQANIVRIIALFLVGGAMHVLAGRIRLPRWAGPAGVGALVAAAVAGPAAFAFLWTALSTYLVLWFAYVPGGLLRRYNALGDYSYGTYIYGFPLQQLVMLLWKDASVLGLTVVAGTGTLVLAVASWHFIEKPMLEVSRMRQRRQTVVASR